MWVSEEVWARVEVEERCFRVVEVELEGQEVSSVSFVCEAEGEWP